MAQTQSVSRRSVVVAAPNQVSSNLDGEAVILDFAAGMYHGLNPTGARVWSLLAQPHSIADICQTLLVEYDVEPAQCERDVIAIVEKLAASGLVEIRTAA